MKIFPLNQYKRLLIEHAVCCSSRDASEIPQQVVVWQRYRRQDELTKITANFKASDPRYPLYQLDPAGITIPRLKFRKPDWKLQAVARTQVRFNTNLPKTLWGHTHPKWFRYEDKNCPEAGRSFQSQFRQGFFEIFRKVEEWFVLGVTSFSEIYRMAWDSAFASHILTIAERT